MWRALLARLDARSLRERVLLLVVAMATIVALADSLVIDGARRAWAAEQGRLAEARSRLATLQAQAGELEARLALDPDAALKARLGALRKEVAQADARLAAAVARFIAPAEMSAVLRALVTRTGGLRLDGLRSLPPARLDAGKDAAKSSPQGPRAGAHAGGKAADPANAQASEQAEAGPAPRTAVWRRGVELRLRGDYAALLAYLRAVEGLPWQLDWELLSVHSEHYPGAEFILRLHTLSLEEDWIGV